jgi:predicted AAA+ superfamily ATPase
MFEKPELKTLKSRLQETRRFIQVVSGPRQVGKTTMVGQLLENYPLPYHFASADAVPSANATWISQQWETARFKRKTEQTDELLLVIDEIQKIENWAEFVKAEWDRDTFEKVNVKVLLLGNKWSNIKADIGPLTGRSELIDFETEIPATLQ